jgi:hypothetical protein
VPGLASQAGGIIGGWPLLAHLLALRSFYGTDRGDSLRPRPPPPRPDGASADPRAVVQAAPDSMLRWLWGRAGDEAVRLTGEEAWAGYLRRMLIAVTQ